MKKKEIQNCENIPVTLGDVHKYVRSCLLYRRQISQYPTIDTIHNDIFDLISRHTLKLFSLKDFRLLLNGIQNIIVQMLQSYFTFTNGEFFFQVL